MKFEYAYRGYYEIRTSPKVQAELQRHADAIADACGPGYEAGQPHTGRRTSRVGVYTDTPEAMVDNAENQTLLNNLEAGRNG